MSSPLDGRSLLCLSSTVCHHPVAQMSKTVKPTQGLQRGDEKRLLGVCLFVSGYNQKTIDAIKDNLNLFNFENMK